MYIQLDFESDIPIYEQLKHEIIFAIAKKQLSPGERLPSVRALASDIGINLHTVNKAYQQLKQDGFLQIHRQRGVVIDPDGPPKADTIYREHLQQILFPIFADAHLRNVTKQDFHELIDHFYDALEKEETTDE